MFKTDMLIHISWLTEHCEQPVALHRVHLGAYWGKQVPTGPKILAFSLFLG